MVKYIKSSDGKFAGSIGLGKSSVPTVGLPQRVSQVAVKNIKTPNISRSLLPAGSGMSKNMASLLAVEPAADYRILENKLNKDPESLPYPLKAPITVGVLARNTVRGRLKDYDLAWVENSGGVWVIRAANEAAARRLVSFSRWLDGVNMLDLADKIIVERDKEVRRNTFRKLTFRKPRPVNFEGLDRFEIADELLAAGDRLAQK